MFHFITISNGVVIVQHATDGHVYRCKPVQRNKWDKLIVSGVEANAAADTLADAFAVAALRFAERMAAECMGGVSDIPDTGPQQGGKGFSAWLNRRRTPHAPAVHEGMA